MKIAKKRTIVNLVMLTLVSSANVLYCQPIPDTEMPNISEKLKSKVTPSIQEETADQYFLQLSQENNINVIIDHSDDSEEKRIKPYPSSPVAIANKWEPLLYRVIIDSTFSGDLSVKQIDDDTFIFWDKPNETDLAIKIANAHVKRYTAKPETNQNLQEIIDSVDSIKDFVNSKELGSKDIEFDKLSVDNKQRILTLIEPHLIEREAYFSFYYLDKFWNDSYIRLTSDKRGGESVQIAAKLGDHTFYDGYMAGLSTNLNLRSK